MPAKNALQAVLDRQVTAKEPPPRPTAPEPSKAVRTYREGKSLVSAHVPKPVHRELKMLAIEEESRSPTPDRGGPLDLLFIKKGKAPMLHPALYGRIKP